MTIEEAILEKLRALPLEKQQEVLDFAEFLHQKHRVTEQDTSVTQSVNTDQSSLVTEPISRGRHSATSSVLEGAMLHQDLDNSKLVPPNTRTADEDSFTAYVEYDPETNLYVGTIPGIVGAHTQAENLDELQDNLKEVLELCLEEYGGKLENLPRFVGIQRIEVGA